MKLQREHLQSSSVKLHYDDFLSAASLAALGAVVAWLVAA